MPNLKKKERKKHRTLGAMWKQSNVFQTKKQDKTSDEKPNEVEISNLPDKEFKAMIIKILIELERRVDEYYENFSKEKAWSWIKQSWKIK